MTGSAVFGLGAGSNPGFPPKIAPRASWNGVPVANGIGDDAPAEGLGAGVAVGAVVGAADERGWAVPTGVGVAPLPVGRPLAVGSALAVACELAVGCELAAGVALAPGVPLEPG